MRQLAEVGGAQTTILRRRLLQLSVTITCDPYWETLPDAPAARVALKQSAWFVAG